MTTINILSERILRILNGGFVTDRSRVSQNEIKHHIGSAANALLRVEMFETTFKVEGGTIPDGVMIATYEGVSVTKGLAGTSQAKLPVTPTYLPNKMGVFSVYPSGQPELEYIPVSTGAYNFVKKEKLLNPIHRKLYEYNSGKVIIYDDLIGAGINTVDMKLCVMDFSHYDGNDPLPVTPEIEMGIIEQVLSLYGYQPKTERNESDQPQPK